MMDVFIGIDVACAKGKYCPISICIEKDGKLVPLHLAKEVIQPPRGLGNVATLEHINNTNYAAAIKAYILSICETHTLNPVRIAIDAPLRPRESHIDRRYAETELDKQKISCFTTPSKADFDTIITKGKMHLSNGGEASRLPHSMQIFMLAGFSIADALKDIAPCIEVFPHATAKLLGAAGKHKTKDDQAKIQLQAISQYTGWPSNESEWEEATSICKGPMHDKVDAYSAAWVASLHVNNRTALGKPELNDAIWLPNLNLLPTFEVFNKFEAPNLKLHQSANINQHTSINKQTDDVSNDFYNNQVQEIAPQYLSLSFNQVHGHWAHYLPTILAKPNATILDVGAGVGRDASHIAKLISDINHDNNVTRVYAVEPAIEMLKVGQSTTQNQKVQWIQDSLPTLDKTTRLEISFDLILLSAVWMHVPPGQRIRAMRKLANLLKPGGKIIISLKFGMTQQEQQQRQMYDVSVEEVEHLAQNLGLISKLESQNAADQLGRDDVYWQTLVLHMPDDGTGAFPFIRQVAINDGKSGTHKLALLRVLLRIADGHTGAVLRRESSANGDRVILPLGLVALYWIHQYKDLIDHHSLFQTPNKSPNMGFMKQGGWDKLHHRTSVDFRVGHLFVGEDALALCKTLSACAQNIKAMPSKYITLPNSNTRVFEVAAKTVKAKDSLFLDLESLTQWGEFSLPESTWLALSRYACWIEPVLVSEWVKTMASYKGNQGFTSPEKQYYLYQALKWEEPVRSTTDVRKRFDILATTQQMQCVWSAKTLKQKYDIDHSMPFARWPNNDLWNLVPSDSKVNNNKRDSLPSEKTLNAAKERMQYWWASAWLGDDNTNQKQRFFAQANIALPGLTPQNDSIDDLFEALLLQRGRLKGMQQLKEW